MLDALIAEQQRLGLTDQAFADALNVPRQTWNAAKMGKRPLSIRVIRSAARRYPHLVEVAHIFLTSDATEMAEVTHSVREKLPSNIDAEASERTRTLVLTTDRATLACRGTAPTGQGQGGSVSVQSVPRTAGKGYVSQNAPASDPARRAADAAEAS